MYAKDGPTILLESFKSLHGILSNPVGHQGAVNTEVPVGENALQYDWFLSQLLCFAHKRTTWLKIYEHDKDDSLLKAFTKYTRRQDESKKQKQTRQT